MKVFMLLVFIPSLITADIICPNSKTSCPDDKQCCEVDGQFSCCDADDPPATRVKVYPGDEIMSSDSFANTSISANESKLFYYGECNLFTCQGTCCSKSPDACCPEKFAACCGNNKCCGSFGKCCSNGCCGVLEKCCGTGCCNFKADCCGTWCCKEGYRCGSRHLDCRSRGAVVCPEIIALFSLAAAVLLSHRV